MTSKLLDPVACTRRPGCPYLVCMLRAGPSSVHGQGRAPAVAAAVATAPQPLSAGTDTVWRLAKKRGAEVPSLKRLPELQPPPPATSLAGPVWKGSDTVEAGEKRAHCPGGYSRRGCLPSALPYPAFPLVCGSISVMADVRVNIVWRRRRRFVPLVTSAAVATFFHLLPPWDVVIELARAMVFWKAVGPLGGGGKVGSPMGGSGQMSVGRDDTSQQPCRQCPPR